MSNENLLRGFFAFLFAAVLGWAVYDRNARENDNELEEGKPRYVPYLPAYILPVFLLAVFGVSCFVYQWQDALNLMLSMCFGIFLHMSVYYALLMLLLPLLRKVISARACAALWLLPNYLYITQQSFMKVPSPRWVLRLNGNWMEVLAAIWLCGFVGVMGWKCLSHIWFRRRILKNAKPVTDVKVLSLWQEEQKQAGSKSRDIHLITSSEVTTPLSIGFFRRTIRVVLPERAYTMEELALIFRHEIVHIGREDSGTKFFLAFCTAMCWFNPLMWLAMHRSADDLELSCDETVLLGADDDVRYQYAQLLLTIAGDERGFTTCLSASASALRYRLSNVTRPRKRFTGGVLAGIIFFALIMSCGYGVLAYDGATGREYIFAYGDYSDYTISSASCHDEDGYRFRTCTDERAFGEYLAALPLYRMTGNFSGDDAYKLGVIYQSPEGLVSVILRDGCVSVSYFEDDIRSGTYYCSNEIDWEYLNSLLY